MDEGRFRELLTASFTWPTAYTFKFVVPTTQVQALHRLFADTKIETRTSRGGRYTSITARPVMQSPEAVIAIYHQAAKIEGLLAL